MFLEKNIFKINKLQLIKYTEKSTSERSRNWFIKQATIMTFLGKLPENIYFDTFSGNKTPFALRIGRTNCIKSKRVSDFEFI